MVVADILKNTFPRLSALDFCFINKENETIHTPLFYVEIYQFIANHSKTLDEIILCNSNCCNERELEPLELSRDHDMPQEEYLDLCERLGNVQVLFLCMELTFYEGRSRFQFGNVSPSPKNIPQARPYFSKAV